MLTITHDYIILIVLQISGEDAVPRVPADNSCAQPLELSSDPEKDERNLESAVSVSVNFINIKVFCYNFV